MLTNKVRILTLAARKKLTMIALALTLMMSNGQRDGDVDHYWHNCHRTWGGCGKVGFPLDDDDDVDDKYRLL